MSNSQDPVTESDLTSDDTNYSSDTGSDGSDETKQGTQNHKLLNNSAKRNENEPNAILRGYERLGSRRVDLVGDYAGNELFFIEGDSLLLHCLTDTRLDFDTGLQLLHAVYNVEHFLQNLVQRKCQFQIIFFDDNQELCIPSSITAANRTKYLLARAVLIRHLSHSTSKTQIPILTFKSFQSTAFKEYLLQTSPYFFMAHDGAQGKTESKAEGTNVPQALAVQRLSFRRMILLLVHRGYNVALLNELEWRDTKVMAVVLETKFHSFDVLESTLSKPGAGLEEDPETDALTELQKLDLSSMQLSEREVLGVLIVARVLQQPLETVLRAERTTLCTNFLLHQACVAHLPLSARRVDLQDKDEKASTFLVSLADLAARALRSPIWVKFVVKRTTLCDVSDFIDGRLFLAICQKQIDIPQGVHATYRRLRTAVHAICGTQDLPPLKSSDETRTSAASYPGEQSETNVLPFSNPIFDKHLESVHIKIGNENSIQQSIASRKIFKEVSHWHNARRPIIEKGIVAGADTWQASRAARRNQLFMAEMRTYAASLTNSGGRSLEPETIIVGTMSELKKQTEEPNSTASTQAKPAAKKVGGGSKTNKLNSRKAAMFDDMAAAKIKKADAADDKIFSTWQTNCKEFDTAKNPSVRYSLAQTYLMGLQPARRAVIGAECELFMLGCLLQIWTDACRSKQQQGLLQLPALIWKHAQSISRSLALPKSIQKCITSTIDALSIPKVIMNTENVRDRKLPFDFPSITKGLDLSVNMPAKQFQLMHCGPFLERSFNAKVDARVDFQPDEWQSQVLDSIDADRSIFVVAPTSAGKTFISFYAMRKVLAADDDGVLVYVAPTKALVNQIAAEIQARYSKSFKYGGKSVWAIHTRDYRINNANGCQVLVTVPHVLQIMLLAPSNAKSWSSRVKRIIFDEVHSIGQAEDGVVWEQLLLMAPCPIIALSATVGNPGEFSQWLASTQEAMGHKLVTVEHPHRYSDLRKYYYVPPKRFSFAGLPKSASLNELGLDGLTGLNYIHPVAALVDKTRGIPQDLALEPRDCFLLWQAMAKVQKKDWPVPKSLNPNNRHQDLSRKVEILVWEKDLKDLLQQWLVDGTSPYEDLLHELGKDFRNLNREDQYTTDQEATGTPQEQLGDEEDYVKSTLPLLCRLNERDALPAILFNYDRISCEDVCRAIFDRLKQAEAAQRKSGPKWQKTLEHFEEWKERKEKDNSKSTKAQPKKSSKKKSGEDDHDDEKTSKLDLQRDAGAADDDKWQSFDPNAPLDGYHFADYSKAQASELEDYARQLRRREVKPWLIEALGRGIGVHHAGMNRKYRQVVEILFRKRFLRVVIATGTLALGINMPCKTVVFSGDSVFLTALNYRQCAGRAGRRGFDLLGNVVFQGVSRQKVCRLISSRLPDLNGHFPITTSLVLRLFTLLHESENSRYAVDAINSLLAQPRLYMGGESFKDQTMHHLRFSIEYLRRQQLLGSDGAPLNFAGLVSHLYYTENSSFAFHALLKEGYFHELCASIKDEEENTVLTLMLVMAHLFNRYPCRKVDTEYKEKVVKPSSSMVFLPPLPEAAASILRDHNTQTLNVYQAYVKTFIDQHISDDDDTLPLSGMKCGARDANVPGGLLLMPPVSARSSFVALSGAGDDFDSVHDLCSTIRSGVFLEEAVIPYMQIYPEDNGVPLNAWLLDFLKHGDVATLEKANGIKRSDVWFLLNDFSLVLATIITSLMNFMKLTTGGDMDMLEVKGGMDSLETAQDDSVAAVQVPGEVTTSTAADAEVRSQSTKTTVKKKSKVADSWDDGGDSEEDAGSGHQTDSAEADKLAEEMIAWDLEGGEGLKNVLKAFQSLQKEFNEKFRAMWA